MVTRINHNARRQYVQVNILQNPRACPQVYAGGLQIFILCADARKCVSHATSVRR